MSETRIALRQSNGLEYMWAKIAAMYGARRPKRISKALKTRGPDEILLGNEVRWVGHGTRNMVQPCRAAAAVPDLLGCSCLTLTDHNAAKRLLSCPSLFLCSSGVFPCAYLNPLEGLALGTMDSDPRQRMTINRAPLHESRLGTYFGSFN